MSEKTLVEELIEIVEQEAQGHLDTLRYVTGLGHIERVLTAAAERVRDLESTNAALTKRVAELEEELFKWESLRRLCPPGVL